MHGGRIDMSFVTSGIATLPLAGACRRLLCRDCNGRCAMRKRNRRRIVINYRRISASGTAAWRAALEE
jgi:hypothetical protein